MSNNKLINLINLINNLFIILFIKFNVDYYYVDTHNVAKRMDLESCIGHFDVQRDMIIRTQESLSIGAKFLDHTDLDSRDDCLRLCCETNNCDVFVFEEKKKLGTCFLFDCGPTHNFKCKFITHSNYTSAVLTVTKKIETRPTSIASIVSNNIKSPASPPNLSQHELELSNLKESHDSLPVPVTTIIPPLGERIVDLPPDVKKCGRFEFQCHSGECIAIYNACDGIPQCIDGSDEGLECSGNGSPGQRIPSSISNGNKQQQNLNTNVQSDMLHPMQQSIQTIQRQYAPPRNREDPMTATQWANRQSNDNQLYKGIVDSHIFNHKGGIQLANSNNVIPQQYMPPNNAFVVGSNDLMPPYQQSLSEPYRIGSESENNILQQQHQQQQLLQQWSVQNNNPIVQFVQPSSVQQQQQQQQLQSLQQLQTQQPLTILSNGNPVEQIQSENDVIVKNDWPKSTKILMDNNKNVDKGKSSSSSNNNNNNKQSIKNVDESENDSTEYSNDDEEDKLNESTQPPPPPQPTRKVHKHKKQEKRVKIPHEDDTDEDSRDDDQPIKYKMVQSHLDMEFLDHDGAAERPGGAVLSLTLGIIVTAALAVLVGCRANVVRRRARRHGKSSYVHDADFLVNGMYL